MAAVALMSVSTVDISAAVSAAIMKPKTPGRATIFATTTNIWSGEVLGGTNSGLETDNALPTQPALPTTIAESGSINNILKVAAPLLMGVLGKQTKENNVNESSGIESLLGGLLSGNSPQQEQSFLESILDADGDGSIVDDVAGMVLGGNKKKGGLAGLLGGLFGK